MTENIIKYLCRKVNSDSLELLCSMTIDISQYVFTDISVNVTIGFLISFLNDKSAESSSHTCVVVSSHVYSYSQFLNYFKKLKYSE